MSRAEVWRWSIADVPIYRCGDNVCCSDWRARGSIARWQRQTRKSWR